MNDTDAAEGEAHDQDDGRAATTRSQAERGRHAFTVLHCAAIPINPKSIASL